MRLASLAIVSAGAMALPVQGGHMQRQAADVRLGERVDLRLGRTTVDRALAALSAQSGLSITAAPYLEDRVVVLEVSGLTVKATMDALAALNGWVWRQTGQRSFRLARPALRPPRTSSEVGAAMRRCLPLDLREFLGLEPPTAVSDGVPHAPLQRAPLAAMGARSALLAAAAARMSPGEDVPWSKLNPGERTLLLEALVFSLFRSEDVDLWSDRPGFHNLDIAWAFLELAMDEILTVSGESSSVRFPAFGANIYRGPGALNR